MNAVTTALLADGGDQAAWSFSLQAERYSQVQIILTLIYNDLLDHFPIFVTISSWTVVVSWMTLGLSEVLSDIRSGVPHRGRIWDWSLFGVVYGEVEFPWGSCLDCGLVLPGVPPSDAPTWMECNQYKIPTFPKWSRHPEIFTASRYTLVPMFIQTRSGQIWEVGGGVGIDERGHASTTGGRFTWQVITQLHAHVRSPWKPVYRPAHTYHQRVITLFYGREPHSESRVKTQSCFMWKTHFLSLLPLGAIFMESVMYISYILAYVYFLVKKYTWGEWPLQPIPIALVAGRSLRIQFEVILKPLRWLFIYETREKMSAYFMLKRIAEFWGFYNDPQSFIEPML